MPEHTAHHLCCCGHGWRYHSRYLNTPHRQCCHRGRIYSSRYVNIYLIVSVVLVMVGESQQILEYVIVVLIWVVDFAFFKCDFSSMFFPVGPTL
jgi:hypothetical protein